FRQILVTHQSHINQITPKQGALRSESMSLSPGKSVGLDKIIERFTGAGYVRVPQVTTRGQYAVRGGIVDLYSWQAQLPLRIEFFGDEIESLREFDIDSQTSVRQLTTAEILLNPVEEQSAVVRDYITPEDLQIEIES